MHPPPALAYSSDRAVDPAVIPFHALATGVRLPAIGLGTFGSDHGKPTQVAEAVKGATRIGYRPFDCVSVYGNEAEVGAALEEVMRSGIKREELWVTSKLWNDKHGEADVIASYMKSLNDLRLEYLDSPQENGLRILGDLDLADRGVGGATGALEPASGRDHYPPLSAGEG